jgi:Ca2+-binding EF-hand superfamily protein
VSVVESYLSFLKISQSQKNEIKDLFQAIDVRRQGQLSKNDIIQIYESSLGTENE